MLYILSRVPDKRTNTNFVSNFISFTRFVWCQCLFCVFFFFIRLWFLLRPDDICPFNNNKNSVIYLSYNISQEKKKNNKFFNEIVLFRPNGIDRRPDWNRFHFRRQQNHFNNFYRPSHEVKSNAKQFHSILNYISIQNKTNCYFYKGSRERERLLT